MKIVTKRVGPAKIVATTRVDGKRSQLTKAGWTNHHHGNIAGQLAIKLGQTWQPDATATETDEGFTFVL